LIANRHPERAERLARDLRPTCPAAEIVPRSLGALRAVDLPPESLLINTTTVGMHGEVSPIPAELLPAVGTVVDLIYNPPRTRLLREAEAAGLRTLNGLPMLVHQAAAAWEIWMDQPAPLEVMSEAARSALGQQR
jgi:shikimate dehydrogenase